MTHDRGIRDGVKRYLDAVAARLGSLTLAEREETLRDVEGHVYDALAARGGEHATPADLEAVLAEMDPPEAYGPEGEPVVPSGPTELAAPKGSLGGWALAVLIGGIVSGLLLAAAGALFAKTRDAVEVTMIIAVVLGVTLELLALVFGILSWRDRRGKVTAIGSGTLFLLWGLAVLLKLLAVDPARNEQMQFAWQQAMDARQAAATSRLVSEVRSVSVTDGGPEIRRSFRVLALRVSRSPQPVDIGDMVNVMGLAKSPANAKPERMLGPVRVVAVGGGTPPLPSASEAYGNVWVEVGSPDAQQFLDAQEKLAEVWVEKVQE